MAMHHTPDASDLKNCELLFLELQQLRAKFDYAIDKVGLPAAIVHSVTSAGTHLRIAGTMMETAIGVCRHAGATADVMFRDAIDALPARARDQVFRRLFVALRNRGKGSTGVCAMEHSINEIARLLVVNNIRFGETPVEDQARSHS